MLIRGVGWQGYQALLTMVADQPVRITYDRGDVELMSLLYKHKRNKSLLARMVEILTEELDIPMIAVGATTLQREDLDRGLEADASFYVADITRIKDKHKLDMRCDPPPDLAIEIEITRSALDRLGVYGSSVFPRSGGSTAGRCESLIASLMAPIARSPRVRPCPGSRSTRWPALSS